MKSNSLEKIRFWTEQQERYRKNKKQIDSMVKFWKKVRKLETNLGYK